MKLFKNTTAKNLLFLSMVVISGLMACDHKPDVIPTDTNIDFLTSVPLPLILTEASAIEIDDNGVFWCLNDGGNAAVLVGIMPNSTTPKLLSFSTAENIDWEDLAYENDTMYIGDFGNNDNTRNDLKIYKISDFSNAGNSNVITETIDFSFEDQVQFPPTESNLHFDVEAFFVSNSKIYLFTKDRSVPFTGITNLYTLESEPGSQVAKRVSTFSTSSVKREGAITAADLSPDGAKMVLISEQQIYLFSDFVAPNYFDGKVEYFDFQEQRQYEGIVFVSDCELAVVNEEKDGVSPNLLTIRICN